MEYTTEVYEFQDGKATVRHPILSPEEREARIEECKRATARYGKALIKAGKVMA